MPDMKGLELLRDVSWLDAMLKRDDEGKLADAGVMTLSHHFGCLYAHLLQW
jgi:hypothetical protein